LVKEANKQRSTEELLPVVLPLKATAEISKRISSLNGIWDNGLQTKRTSYIGFVVSMRL
jgi:hypothetical protein